MSWRYLLNPMRSILMHIIYPRIFSLQVEYLPFMAKYNCRYKAISCLEVDYSWYNLFRKLELYHWFQKRGGTLCQIPKNPLKFHPCSYQTKLSIPGVFNLLNNWSAIQKCQMGRVHTKIRLHRTKLYMLKIKGALLHPNLNHHWIIGWIMENSRLKKVELYEGPRHNSSSFISQLIMWWVR